MVEPVAAPPGHVHRGIPDPPREHHRDVQGGAARAGVFGVSDGLITNVSLILGVVGANPSAGIVRLVGLAGLAAGAFSMAAGEYVSMSAQSELIHRELAVEKEELRRHPGRERRELVSVYMRRGVPRETAEAVTEALMKDPEVALEVHSREELGVDPARTGSPVAAALASFASFAVGALLPLLPWFFLTGIAAVVSSIVLGTLGCVVVGAGVAYFAERPYPRTVLRQLLIAAAAAAATFAVGRLVGGITAV
ncbi:MAG: VIT1/CCC1 transporter family protein [Candidatus Dormibacteria bacterium]|jgi:VIT1/CCC1 family predicted Fe2+/Mn2+ transporter